MRFSFALLLLLLGSVVRPAQAQINVVVSPAETRETSTGSTFGVDVHFQTYSNLFGYSVELFYNPAALKHTAISPGPILDPGGSKFCTTSGSSAGTGRILIDCVILGGSSVSGSDAVAFSVTFLTVATGGSDLFYGNVRLRDADNNALAYTLEDGLATVVSPLPSTSASLRYAASSSSATYGSYGSTGVDVRVVSTTSGGTVTAMRYDVEPPGGAVAPFSDPDASVTDLGVTDAYWEVTSSLTETYNLDLGFSYAGLSGPNDPNDYRVARRDLAAGASDAWALVPASETTVDTGNERVLIDGAVGTYSSGQYALVYDAPSIQITGAEGWRMFGMTATGQTYGTYLDGLWTQGFPGADASETDPFYCNAFTYDPTWVDEADRDYNDDGLETARDGWRCIAGQTSALGQGEAVMVYVFSDVDNDETPEGFPKSILIPTPFAAAPFAFSGLDYADNADISADQEGFNFRGNPLSEPFSWDLLEDGVDYDDLNGTIYVYDPDYNLGDYRTRNAKTGDLTGGLVPSSQGFLVQATGPNPALSIPAGAVGGSQGFYGRTAAPKALRFELRQGGVPVAASFVRFDENADASVDALDSYRLAPFRWPYVTLASLPLIGTDTNGDGVDEYPPLVQNAVPVPTSEATDVPLVVEAAGYGTEPVRLQLVWEGGDALPATWHVELHDLETGTVVDLSRQEPYEFDVAPEGKGTAAPEAGPLAAVRETRPPRFVLRVSDKGGVEDEVAPTALRLDLAAEPNPTTARFSVTYSLPQGGRVHLALFDLLGREVQVLVDDVEAEGPHRVPVSALSLPGGVYLLRLATAAGVVTSKLTIAR